MGGGGEGRGEEVTYVVLELLEVRKCLQGWNVVRV